MTKGRKVFRNKKKYRKKRIEQVAIVLLILIIVAVVVFFGYSIIDPIINFFKNDDNTSIETEPWTPTVTTTQTTEESLTDSAESQTTAAENTTGFVAYTLSSEDLATKAALEKALDTVKANGYTVVVAVLKSQGGQINYVTGSEFAATAELKVNSELNAKQIADIIKSNEITPIAKISVLNDNNRYGANRVGSYKIASDNSTWLDNAPSAGGKPWLSPFETDTQEYYKYLIKEISDAGFSEIICDDMIFPTFRNSDLNYIGEKVTNPQRYKALITLTDVIVNSVTDKSKIIIETDSIDIISGKSEILKPQELKNVSLAVNYSVNVIPASDTMEADLSKMDSHDRTKEVFTIIKSGSGELNIIPYINSEGINQSELDEIIKALNELGYQSYYIY